MSLAKNTKLLIGDAQAPTEGFTEILKATEISWSGVSWDSEETTNHSATERARTSVPTLYSNGDVTLTILYSASNTQHALLRTLSTTGAARNFQLHQVSGEEKQFEGYVTNFGFDTPVDGELKANVTVMINGAMSDVA